MLGSGLASAAPEVLEIEKQIEQKEVVLLQRRLESLGEFSQQVTT